MTSKDDASLSRKEQILDAAAALFAEKGYYKTTTAEVARSVGVTQPYVFHFFTSKESLYLAVLERAHLRILDAFTTVNAPPEQLAERMGKAFVELLLSHRDEILLVMMSYTTPEPAVRARTRQEFDIIYERVKLRFEQAGLPDAADKASVFIGHGLLIAMSETLDLPHLCRWRDKPSTKF
ncbi:TetR/AcrR family transcriptional regulator [Paenibacillus sacheonensis]|uniref:TetR family transcriptional regulator n=1 Tax=Paenibacillus sacheonensis TaxID=742054 RepID=A0A7X4YTQ4_9BACL|nr:TetR/AcrR family transcriptional regulator [Paenibacillus sacheonensis]MBM7568578.1 AcrR family transcriptional regulator [Paenibacillus sacheonensis]NBC72398.1 TetR family transcriptional regulator [Paenibacillus sacheonensis]